MTRLKFEIMILKPSICNLTTANQGDREKGSWPSDGKDQNPHPSPADP